MGGFYVLPKIKGKVLVKNMKGGGLMEALSGCDFCKQDPAIQAICLANKTDGAYRIMRKPAEKKSITAAGAIESCRRFQRALEAGQIVIGKNRFAKIS